MKSNRSQVKLGKASIKRKCNFFHNFIDLLFHNITFVNARGWSCKIEETSKVRVGVVVVTIVVTIVVARVVPRVVSRVVVVTIVVVFVIIVVSSLLNDPLYTLCNALASSTISPLV